MSRKLILSGLPLENPYVGQGVYTLRIIQGLRRMKVDFSVVIPLNLTIPKELAEEDVVRLPKLATPQHALLRQILVSRQLLNFVRYEFPEAIFHSPGPIAGRAPPAGKEPR